LEKEKGIIKSLVRPSFFKRPFDIILSSIGLLGSSWLFALFCILIIIEDGFPVFIRQGRIGKGGRIFKSIKFRSMVKGFLREKINRQAYEDDSRITRIGRSMRKVAMDELPQLFNILIGDMSFVGPRPLLPVEIEVNGNLAKTSKGADPFNGEIRIQHIRDIPGYAERIRVVPGLTGLAQIYAPRDLPRGHKFKYDLLYIRRQSLGTDLKLIFLSFIISFRGTWERRGAKLSSLKRGKDGSLRERD